jgi:hypothetical protein
MSKINESDRESARRGIHEIESAYLKFEQSEAEAYWRISALTLAAWQAIPDIAHAAASIHADIAGLDAWLALLNQSEKRCHPDNAAAPIRNSEIEKIETAWPQASAAIRRVLYAVTADENESTTIATIGAPILLTVGKAATKIGVKPKQVYKLATEGKIERVGKCYTLKSIEDYRRLNPKKTTTSEMDQTGKEIASKRMHICSNSECDFVGKTPKDGKCPKCRREQPTRPRAKKPALR